MKKKFAGIGLILILIMSTMSFVSASSEGFTTERFDVDVTVEENHVIHVSETIDVNFFEARHGIFRYIPVDRKSYKVESLEAVGDLADAYEEDGRKVLQIGDPDRVITGNHTYHINYDLVCYEDQSEEMDYFSLDLLPPEWETSIEAAEIVVHFPKAVDAEKVTIYSGKYGTEGNAAEAIPSFSADGKTMTIKVDNIERRHAVTVLAELPEGYWSGEANRDWMMIPLVALILIIPLLVFIMWVLFGRDPKLVKTVEFYPPENMTPAEIGYAVDGSLSQEELSSMIVYFAEKGYLDIHEYEEDKFELVKKNSIAESEKRFAKTLFDGYFSQGDIVRMDELPEDLADFYDVATEQLENLFDGEKKLHSTMSRICRVTGGILYLALAVIPGFLSAMMTFNISWELALAPLILTGAIGIFLTLLVYDSWYSSSKTERKGTMILAGILLAANMIINAATMIMLLNNILLALLIVLSLIITIVFLVLMNARTKNSVALLGKILGFRDFIETAELDKLKLMVEENPSYFYHIMPYASIFGLSDIWIKHFEKIPVSKPGWYSGHRQIDTWDVYWYSRMMNRCMTSMNDSISEMITASEDTGSGGFGGGGFSGGGFGGGGGGSW